MRKTLLALLLCAATLLSACSTRKTMEDLLTAPSLTTDQIAVREAIEAEAGAPIGLKYPLSGDRRAPIQFADLDGVTGDGDPENEAIVFYSAGDATSSARMAVLRKTGNGEWEVADSIEGREADVESVNFTRIADNQSRVILVEWVSTNRQNKYLSVYRFQDERIEKSIEEDTSKLIVYDLNKDNFDEFMYVTLPQPNETFMLNYVDWSGNRTTAEPVRRVLNKNMGECLALTAGFLVDGTPAIFVDERVAAVDESGAEEESQQVTEVFVLRDGKLRSALSSETDITKLTRREQTDMHCMRLYEQHPDPLRREFVYIPSVEKPSDKAVLQNQKWTYWYSIEGDNVSYQLATYVNSENRFALAVPDSWLEALEVRTDENQTWTITNAAKRFDVLSVRVVYARDNAVDLDGYEMVGQVGAAKYYLKYYLNGEYPVEDYEFVKQNFIIF